VVVDLRYARSPSKLYTCVHGVIDQELMQFHAPHGQAYLIRKISAHGMLFINESNSSKLECGFGWKGNPKCL
jgi:hypothetical protein